MKAFLVCPSSRSGVPFLAETAPLATRPVLGKSLLEYWLEYLVRHGAREVIISAADRPHQIRVLVGDGCRWGLRVHVLPQPAELSLFEARAMYHPNGETDWIAAPHDFNVMDHLPALPSCPLFNSYMGWFAGVMAALRQFEPRERIGLREIQAGIWVGQRARLARTALLRPPCWIGSHVAIGPRTVVGPMTVLEDRVVVEKGARIAQSIIGPDSFVGAWTELRQSLVEGNRLLNWRNESSVRITDEFWLCSLHQPGRPPLLRRVRAALGQWLRPPAHSQSASPAPVEVAPVSNAVRPLPGESSAKRAA